MPKKGEKWKPTQWYCIKLKFSVTAKHVLTNVNLQAPLAEIIANAYLSLGWSEDDVIVEAQELGSHTYRSQSYPSHREQWPDW